MSVDLTILIPTFNRADVLEATLEAMCRVRRERWSVEFVIVDNGSSDRTAAVLQAYSSRLPLRALFEPTAGKCHALNRALRDVKLGEIVVFTDDDVTPDESWLEEIVSVSSRWPQYSVFGGRIDPAWPVSVPVPFWAKHRHIQQFAFSAHHVGDREAEYASRQEPFGPNYWVRREALDGAMFRAELGPHPKRRTLGDETEFLRQLRRRGFAPLYAPSARVQHRIEPERTSEAAIYRRAYQYGRGCVHADGMPEQSLLDQSRAAWGFRLVSNVAVGTLQLLGALLEPDEQLRFTRVVGRVLTLAKNLEALRCVARGRTSLPSSSIGTV